MEANLENRPGMDERLWSYIEGSATPGEQTVIEKLLESEVLWKEKYKELLELNSLLQSAELEAPSMRFTKNVMEEISRLHIAPATRTYINKRIIWGLGIFFITMVLGFLVYGFGQVNWSSGNSSAFSEKISNVDYSKFFSNTWVNAFMMVNVVLGLFLLDVYLSSRRKQYRKEM